MRIVRKHAGKTVVTKKAYKKATKKTTKKKASKKATKKTPSAKKGTSSTGVRRR